MNIVDVIKGNLSPSVLGQLGSLIGASPEQTQAAAGAAVPTILAGMGKMASTKDGADRLSDILSKIDPSMVDNMGGMFTGDNAGKVETQGGGMLDNVLGGGGILGTLGGLLSKFSGVGGEAIKKLLKFLGPLILGIIAKQLGGKTSGAGLSQFFSEQKNNIANSFPAGFSLGNIPGLGDAAATVQQAANTVKQGVSQLTWLLPILLVALGLALWFYFRPEEPVKLPANPDIKSITKSLGATMDGQVQDFFDTATFTLNGIKDAATADSALPKLKELDGKLDALKKNFDKVPESGKGAIKTLLATGLSNLKALVEKLLAMPGVGEKLKPVVEPLMAKLTAIAG